MTATKNRSQRCLAVDAFGAAAFLVVAGLAWQFGVRPMLAHQSNEALALAELAASQQEASDGTAKLGELKTRIRQFEQDMAGSRVRLRSADRLNAQLAALNDLAGACGLSVEAVQPGKAQPGKRVDWVPITMLARCDYARSARFLHTLTERMPDVGVVTFELTDASSADETPATFRIGLRWFVEPDRVAKAGAASGARGGLR